MDGDTRQEEMLQRLKREVKENAHHHRRVHSTARSSNARSSNNREISIAPLKTCASRSASASRDLPVESHSDCGQITNLPLRNPPESARLGEASQWSSTLEWSDTILLSFYIEHVFPFLFPFHNPCPLQGGRAWILKLISSSPVVRQAMLCQSSYFLYLSQGPVTTDSLWETVLKQTKEAFEVLRAALQVIQDSDVSKHVRGTVRILASIMQVLRFEITVLSFNNYQAHLTAAVSLFKQLLNVPGTSDPALGFTLTMDLLSLPNDKLAAQFPHVPSAEQTAFQFTSSLLILDDIIASTALQKSPVLHDYHKHLLTPVNGADSPLINLEVVLSCQNWVLLQIGEIAVLDAQKQKETDAGQADYLSMNIRAKKIQTAIESNLKRLENEPPAPQRQIDGLINALTSSPNRDCSVGHNTSITRVWAYAALIYLAVAQSWSPCVTVAESYPQVRAHVETILNILTHEISPPEMLRTMAWPLCVAGCMADERQETRFREMVSALQPASVFGTIRQALAVMERVWEDRNRAPTEREFFSLASCFTSQGSSTLLV